MRAAVTPGPLHPFSTVAVVAPPPPSARPSAGWRRARWTRAAGRGPPSRRQPKRLPVVRWPPAPVSTGRAEYRSRRRTRAVVVVVAFARRARFITENLAYAIIQKYHAVIVIPSLLPIVFNKLLLFRCRPKNSYTFIIYYRNCVLFVRDTSVRISNHFPV